MASFLDTLLSHSPAAPAMAIYHALAGGGHHAAAAPATTYAASGTTAAPTSQVPTQTVSSEPNPLQGLLSAILGQQQGYVPQGYANFFTNVVGPMQQSLQQSFGEQLSQALGAGPAPGVPKPSAADQAALDKAYGPGMQGALGSLQALNNASLTQASPGAAEFGNFISQLTNTQKLIQSLQNALSFIPYSASGIGTLPPAAADVLSALGVQGLAGLGATGTAAGAVTGATPSQAPKLPG